MAASHPLKFALYANAAALVLVGGLYVNRPAAVAQPVPQPIAGGAGLFLMPGQLATNTWGCYLMDVDRQTLMVYQYQTGNPSTLKLLAARDFSSDRRLRQHNTDPAPGEVQKLVELEAAAKNEAGK